MKLIRFGEPGRERPGLQLPSGIRVDASGAVGDYDEAFFEDGGVDRLRRWGAEAAPRAPALPPAMRLGPPIARPGKIVCVGLNYRDHAAESGMDIPKEPVLFLKATSAIVGPDDAVVIPRGGSKLDYEVELGVVIGRRASYVEPERAMSHVAGYVLMNDYSERAFQLERAGQWVKGKSCDTFAPIGPFVATADEIPDPHKLTLTTRLNGQEMQKSGTDVLIHDIPAIISFCSKFTELSPGDVIATGTPEGIGGKRNPPVWMKAGDTVVVEIEKIGRLENPVSAET